MKFDKDKFKEDLRKITGSLQKDLKNIDDASKKSPLKEEKQDFRAKKKPFENVDSELDKIQRDLDDLWGDSDGR